MSRRWRTSNQRTDTWRTANPLPGVFVRCSHSTVGSRGENIRRRRIHAQRHRIDAARWLSGKSLRPGLTAQVIQEIAERWNTPFGLGGTQPRIDRRTRKVLKPDVRNLEEYLSQLSGVTPADFLAYLRDEFPKEYPEIQTSDGKRLPLTDEQVVDNPAPVVRASSSSTGKQNVVLKLVSTLENHRFVERTSGDPHQSHVYAGVRSGAEDASVVMRYLGVTFAEESSPGGQVAKGGPHD
jgi:hypothetical protein